MIIALLSLLFLDCSVAEKYRYERLQGECSAWCNQEFGTLKKIDIKNNGEDEVEVFLCDEDDQACRDCNVACSHDFHTLRHCFARCGGKEACQQGCRYHEKQSRVEINEVDYANNLSYPYPPDIYEIINRRENDSIVIYWNEMQQFPEPRSIVFLVFLINITRPNMDLEDIDAEEALYLGSTPLHQFKVKPLSPQYCYAFKIMTVTSTFLLGRASSEKKFYTNAVVHIDNITATSAHIWFKIRPCNSPLLEFQPAKLITMTSDIYDATDLQTTQHNFTYEAFAYNLIPNKEYSVNIERKFKYSNPNELHSIVDSFRTLPASPGSTVEVKSLSSVTPTEITVSFKVADMDRMWRTDPVFYMLRVRTDDGTLFTEVKIPTSSVSGMWTVGRLNPATMYCVAVSVANKEGLGPESEIKNCTETAPTGAGPPSITIGNTTSNSIDLIVTRPDPPNGVLTYYNISYIESVEMQTLSRKLEGGQTQTITIPNLNQDFQYTFSVRAVNSNGDVGKAAVVEVSTLPSYPESAPQLSSCHISTNGSHVIVAVTWISIDQDLVNGDIEYYTLNLVHYDYSDAKSRIVSNVNYTARNWSAEVIEVSNTSLSLKYTNTEAVMAKLAVANQVGLGPWSRDNYNCTIVAPPKMGKDLVQYIVPVACVFSVCVILLLVFVYFFRLRPYKKTPYEEIPKLIGPDTFSPCQHCLQNKDPKRWDVFICHVSEDLEYVVKLKEAFVREKIEVFFAKDELSWGCELHRVINDGLRFSKYGLVVLSKHFVDKCSKWTSAELSSLHSKSKITSQDCILPIWKRDVTEVEVGDFDMTLVGIHALKEEDMSVDQMAVQLKKKLRNDGCWGCSLRMLNQNQSGGSTPKSSDDALLAEDISEDRDISSPDEEQGTNV